MELPGALKANFLAVGCLDAKIYLWDMAKRQQAAVLSGHQGYVTRVAFSHAGDLLVSSSDDGTTRVWNPATTKHLLTVAGLCHGISLDDRLLAIEHGEELSVWERSNARELVTLSGAATTLDFSAREDLLATAGQDGVHVWEVSSAREVADLRLDHCETATFCPTGDSLVSYGKCSGLLLWPLRDKAADSRPRPAGRELAPGRRTSEPARGWQLGPPQALERTLIHSWQRASWSRDGRWLAVADNRNKMAFLLNPERPLQRQILGTFPDLATIALSPDGKWAAAGASDSRLVKVWHVPTAKAVQDFPGCREAAFSPDGQWVITSSRDNYRSWHVGTWEPGWLLPRDQRIYSGEAPLAFSPDGCLLALARSPQRIQLVDPATGREIATLSAPGPSAITSLCFSPDGSRLGVANGREGVHLWDLRAIRQQLADLGLDWSLPPYPPAEDLKTTTPVHVHVLQDPKETWRSYWLVRGRAHQVFAQPSEAVIDFTEALKILPADTPSGQRAELLQLRARNLIRIRGYDAALADLQKAVELAPDSPTACHELARFYVLGPARLRDPREAWRLALQAVNLRPGERTYQSTLALVYYRLGLYPQAMETLERNGRDSTDEVAASDLFFRAMCHARRGEAMEAKKCFDRAVQWVQEQQGKLRPQAKADLDAFRAEAQALVDPKAPSSLQPGLPTSPETAGVKPPPFTGHAGPISSVAWSAKGERVLTGSADQTAILWDAQTGSKLRTFTGHTDIVSSVALSEDEQRVLTGAFDFTASLWDATTGARLRAFAGHTREVISVALSRDRQRVLTGSWDQTAILWDADSGSKLQTFAGHSSFVNSVALSGDGRRVLTGSADGTAILWDAQSGAKLGTFTGHTGPVNCVGISEDGQRVLTGSADRTAILWDAQSGAKLCTFTGHSQEVLSVAQSRDEQRVLTGSQDQTAILWDAQSAAILRTFAGHSDEVRSVALSRDGRRMLTGSLDHTAILWDVQSGAQLPPLAGQAASPTP